MNCTGEILDGANFKEEIKREMVRQCNEPVQWMKTMQVMISQGTKIVIESGPGHSLCGLMKNMTKDMKLYYMDDRKGIMKLLKTIK